MTRRLIVRPAAQLGPLLERLAKEVAAGDVQQTQALGDELRLGPLAGTGRAEQDHVHALFSVLSEGRAGVSG